MNESLTKELQEVINKNLPSQFGDVLKSRLTELESIEKKYEDLRLRHAALFKEDAEKSMKLSQHTSLESKIEALTKQESEVDKKLLRLEISELKVQSAEQRNRDLKEVVGMVFKNNVMKYTESGNMPVPISGGPSGCGFVSNATYHKTTEVER